MCKRTKKLIYKFNFKKKYLDDKSGWWLEKKLKHKFLKKLRIIIEDDIIILSCKNYDTVYKKPNSIVDIYICKFTWKNLNNILKEFK